jgi:hypothetical protein
VLSEGGMVVVAPGAVDWSVEAGADVDVSAGGELAEPPGEVDSCLEQADRSASEPTHNNRTLRFIRSPHYCNGTVTRILPARTPNAPQRVASRVPAPLHCVALRQHTRPRPCPGHLERGPWYSQRFLM